MVVKLSDGTEVVPGSKVTIAPDCDEWYADDFSGECTILEIDPPDHHDCLVGNENGLNLWVSGKQLISYDGKGFEFSQEDFLSMF